MATPYVALQHLQQLQPNATSHQRSQLLSDARCSTTCFCAPGRRSSKPDPASPWIRNLRPDITATTYPHEQSSRRPVRSTARHSAATRALLGVLRPKRARPSRPPRPCLLGPKPAPEPDQARYHVQQHTAKRLVHVAPLRATGFFARTTQPTTQHVPRPYYSAVAASRNSFASGISRTSSAIELSGTWLQTPRQYSDSFTRQTRRVVQRSAECVISASIACTGSDHEPCNHYTGTGATLCAAASAGPAAPASAADSTATAAAPAPLARGLEQQRRRPDPVIHHARVPAQHRASERLRRGAEPAGPKARDRACSRPSLFTFSLHILLDADLLGGLELLAPVHDPPRVPRRATGEPPGPVAPEARPARPRGPSGSGREREQGRDHRPAALRGCSGTPHHPASTKVERKFALPGSSLHPGIGDSTFDIVALNEGTSPLCFSQTFSTGHKGQQLGLRHDTCAHSAVLQSRQILHLRRSCSDDLRRRS